MTKLMLDSNIKTSLNAHTAKGSVISSKVVNKKKAPGVSKKRVIAKIAISHSKKSASAAPKKSAPAAPKKSAPAAPKKSAPAAPKKSAPAAPKKSAPAAPKKSAPAAPKKTVTKVKRSAVTSISEKGISKKRVLSKVIGSKTMRAAVKNTRETLKKPTKVKAPLKGPSVKESSLKHEVQTKAPIAKSTRMKKNAVQTKQSKVNSRELVKNMTSIKRKEKATTRAPSVQKKAKKITADKLQKANPNHKKGVVKATKARATTKRLK